ncbi:Carbamoyltransferase HypF [Hydrogenovibrio crunogenus]|uniref:Carbamoyltransferase HypF n=1 Tax=Hydrogenovibrio crunogenus TaxID=39765 RepID=A0A4P7P1S9_9GAMM|nr:carbamoyltransferase HypF [Hydrogenovibrio crunogenus]QBZ84081.1 Carbamoyltransferase HypF [Hydrogenovibrio crunogenus]
MRLSNSLAKSQPVPKGNGLTFEETIQLRLHLFGRVQGVGFRPFIFQLAQLLGLRGSVANDTQGVEVWLQGTPQAIQQFQQCLTSQKPDFFPKQAVIDGIESHSVPLAEQKRFENFSIIASSSENQESQAIQISPDLAVCDHCLQEFHDPTNRRYHDPFINCSDCGPRYSILSHSPYDRPHSSMQAYTMCAACAAEYQNPNSRRFHTQGICCPDCGPRITLFDALRHPLAEGATAIQQAAQCLKTAGLVAFKGVGGFHLLCNATDSNAVATLRQRKRRATKPFAVLCSNLEMAQQIAHLSSHEIELLTSEVKPIVLVEKRTDSDLCEEVASNIHRLGVFLAYTPLHHLLFQLIDFPLVATSANLSGEPILYEASDVFEKLCQPNHSLVEAVLDFDREIVNPCDDSIVQSINGKSMVLRLGRGLAPYYQPLSHQAESPKKTALAVGAQQKSAVACDDGKRVMLSPYLGELGSLAAFQRFQYTLQSFLTLHHLTPNQVMSDIHPDYASSQWAAEYAQQNALPYVTVQHHYAHALACMVEHQLESPVLAFCWDGTGLGDDLSSWGGEVLLADKTGYERVLHVKPFKLLGGDQASRQPRRVALGLLFDFYSLETVLTLDVPTIDAFSQTEIEQLYSLYQRNLNSPFSSSMGRVFDAIASLCGIVQTLDYEGQSGLWMEPFYDNSITEAYDCRIKQNQIDFEPMIQQLIMDHQQGVAISTRVSRFLNALVNVIDDVAHQFKELPVIVTGGVFQNKTLMALLERRFVDKARPFYFQQHTPLNDGSIALGQLLAKRKASNL